MFLPAPIRTLLISSGILVCLQQSVRAQRDTAIANLPAIHIDKKAIDGLNKKYSALQGKINSYSTRLLSHMQVKENKLYRKINEIDSVKAEQLFTDNVKQQYSDLQTRLCVTTNKLNVLSLKEYVPGLDSMQTSLSFLSQNPNFPADKIQQLQSLSAQMQNLQSQLQKANDIQAFISEREAILKEQLKNTALAKHLTGINKQVYYYQARISEYKEILNDKEKLKEKILATVRTLPAFETFWQRYSYLAMLFPNVRTTVAEPAPGLQTRTSVETLIAQRIGSGGTSIIPGEYMQQQVGAAQVQITQVRNKLAEFTGGNSDMTMPDFKPNEQKTKTFLQRLEYGFNVQTAQYSSLLPVTSDVALMLGYKLSSNKIFGIGASFKLGWGSGWNDIKFTNQGLGLRSYIDIKAKGSIWLTGGFEYNYLSQLNNIQDLQNYRGTWQHSALIGLSKKYRINKSREGNIQVLYDFLHNQQSPPARGLKFRLGYMF